VVELVRLHGPAIDAMRLAILQRHAQFHRRFVVTVGAVDLQHFEAAALVVLDPAAVDEVVGQDRIRVPGRAGGGPPFA
jgi:hypothetical protein